MLDVRGLAAEWRTVFRSKLVAHDSSRALCEAATAGRLRPWTEALTAVVVDACADMGWVASAKGHEASVLPVGRCEYLSLDVMAFGRSEADWHYPAAVFELENSRRADTIAYSLWKLLCVEADLRVLYCYRKDRDETGPLVEWLGSHVVTPMLRQRPRRQLGETVVVVGTRAAAETFPDGFFHWWALDAGAGRLRLM